ncbi:MAG: Bax inhibitor-1/YccA family protein [Proteobacteria bacterium]|nr:Bax inhibitor-1/YccA family protein [Pseudomonadota bacterium]
MADLRTQFATRAADDAHIDVGLRSYMLKVYNYMGSGVMLTFAVAWAVAQSPALAQAAMSMSMVLLIATVGLVFFLSARIDRIKASTAQAIFWVYSAMFGLILSTFFLVYTGESIARVFFITAATFGAMSLYGYTTKRDLTGIGSFLFMGMIGLIIAIMVNWFLESSALHFAVSVIGVLIFVGLTAFDTQKIKEMYLVSDSGEVAAKKSVLGALKLYMDFIGIFIYLMALFGGRE